MVSSCSTITIKAQKIDLTEKPIQSICIEYNTKVLVSDFVEVMQSELSKRKIKSTIVSDKNFKGCPIKLTYTARRSWDLKPFMTMARVNIWENGTLLGSASFDQVSGLGFSKFDSTEVKLAPVFKKLFNEDGSN